MPPRMSAAIFRHVAGSALSTQSGLALSSASRRRSRRPAITASHECPPVTTSRTRARPPGTCITSASKRSASDAIPSVGALSHSRVAVVISRSIPPKSCREPSSPCRMALSLAAESNKRSVFLAPTSTEPLTNPARVGEDRAHGGGARDGAVPARDEPAARDPGAADPGCHQPRRRGSLHAPVALDRFDDRCRAAGRGDRGRPRSGRTLPGRRRPPARADRPVSRGGPRDRRRLRQAPSRGRARRPLPRAPRGGVARDARRLRRRHRNRQRGRDGRARPGRRGRGPRAGARRGDGPSRAGPSQRRGGLVGDPARLGRHARGRADERSARHGGLAAQRREPRRARRGHLGRRSRRLRRSFT